MKKWTLVFSIFTGILNLGFSWAQNIIPTPNHNPGFKGTPSGKLQPTGPNMHAINLRVRSQLQQVHEDLRSGKLTNDQAKAIMIKLKSVRQLELKFFRENNQREITTEQKNQIDTVLDQTNGSL